jgi:hypothetical protein
MACVNPRTQLVLDEAARRLGKANKLGHVLDDVAAILERLMQFQPPDEPIPELPRDDPA